MKVSEELKKLNQDVVNILYNVEMGDWDKRSKRARKRVLQTIKRIFDGPDMRDHIKILAVLTGAECVLESPASTPWHSTAACVVTLLDIACTRQARQESQLVQSVEQKPNMVWSKSDTTTGMSGGKESTWLARKPEDGAHPTLVSRCLKNRLK